MSALSILTFAVVFGVACASPGPTTVALVARVVGKGHAGMPAFCAGLLLGDLVWLACAALGLAALASLFQPVFLVLNYLGAAYLLYLAWKLWTAPATAPGEGRQIKGEGIRLFFGGLALALGNPKTMLFYLAILPTIVSMSDLTWLGFAELALVVVVVYSSVLGSYAVLAGRARRVIRSPRAIRVMNRASGTGDGRGGDRGRGALVGAARKTH